tara:strand:- start:116 stop:1279 length:1164 start_codon:yes stop_codon:yes gene_type:complete
MAIKIASLAHTQPEVGSLAYVQLKIASLVYTELGLSKLTYVNPTVDTVYLDPSPKNKILHEIYGVVDQYLVDVTLNKYDSVSTADVYVLAIEKAAHDIVDLVEYYAMDVTKSTADYSVVLDIVRLAVNKAFSDSTGISDTYDIATIKGVNDSIVSTDVFSLVANYVRRFSDYVALDDFAGIDKYYNGTKHNVVGTEDFAVFALSMLKEDSVGAFDVIDSISTGKSLEDTVALTEAFSKIFTHTLVDSNLVDDMVELYTSKYINDNAAVSDSSIINTDMYKADTTNADDTISKIIVVTSNDTIGTADAINRSIIKIVRDGVAVDDRMSFGDATALTKHNIAFIGDILQIQSSKEVADVATVIDTVTVLYSPGNLVLFNNTLFNESTFG